MSKSSIRNLFTLMTGVMGGLAIAHFAGEDRLDDIHFWLTPLWLLLAYGAWRTDTEGVEPKHS